MSFGTIHPVIPDTGAPRPNGYEQFFGFAEPPFSLAVNPRFRFASASHEAALAQVTYAVQRREPVIVVTGDIGMGKTLLCRTVVERLPRKTFLSVIHDPLLGRDDFLKRILQDFGVISIGNAGALDPGRHELVHALERFLASLAPLEAHAVVILDEAQHVQPEVLEQIRLAANVCDDRGTLLQIMLVGQPDLQTLLARPELQQLRQRVARFVSLDALTEAEVSLYISHRLVVARQSETESSMPGAFDLARAIAEWDLPVTFRPDAVETVFRLSRGVPRLVNLLCDRGLEAAYAKHSTAVDAGDITAAAAVLQLPHAAGDSAGPTDIRDAAEHGDAGESMAHTDTGDSTVPADKRRASPRWRYAAAVAALALAGAVVWFGARKASPPAAAPPIQQSVQRSAVEKPPPQPPPRPAAPATSETPSAPAKDPPAETPDEGFEIVVASFRTEARANDVAGQLAALGQRVRQRSIGGWQQVIAGPFVERTAADEAQRQLDRQGFTGTQIVRESR